MTKDTIDLNRSLLRRLLALLSFLLPFYSLSWVVLIFHQGKMVNGSPFEKSNQSCSNRQENPLSLLIFILCMERLSQAIDKLNNVEEWKPTVLKKWLGSHITHAFFVDNLIVWGGFIWPNEADDEMLERILWCIKRKC